MSRPLYVIAKDIRQDWEHPYFGAVPYLNAMMVLREITDNYLYDTARSIVNYFLANASSWRGPKAREIKAELKGILKA
jgi:hypothetical protein